MYRRKLGCTSKIRHLSFKYLSNNLYNAHLEILGRDHLYDIYQFIRSTNIWSTGQVCLVFRLRSESKGTNTDLLSDSDLIYML
jgi:hypothetical protein